MGDLPGTYTGTGALALDDEHVEAEQLGINLRAADGRLFEGASDEAVRQQARTAAEADVSVRVKDVAAGGEVLGAEVGERQPDWGQD